MINIRLFLKLTPVYPSVTLYQSTQDHIFGGGELFYKYHKFITETFKKFTKLYYLKLYLK